MKRILVISDTHGNQKLMRHVCLAEEYEILFHLGDDYSDLNLNNDIIEHKDVYRVPGMMNFVADTDLAPLILHLRIEDWNFQLVHRPEDTEVLPDKDEIVLFGHTHHPGCHFHQGILYANPGHLKSSHHRNHGASYLMIYVDKDNLKMEWKDMEGKVFLTKELTRGDF